MKLIKNILLIVVVLVLGYFSIDIKPLDELRKAAEGFDADAYAQHFVQEVLPTSFYKTIPLADLADQLQNDKEVAFEKWSHAIAIGNIGYFLVNTTGKVNEITEDEVVLEVSEGITVRLQTEFIYGNAIRDASGLIDNKEFPNTSDLNAVAAMVNDIIRQDSIPPFKRKVQLEDSISVIGAVEMNKKFPPLNEFEIQPVQIQIH